MWTDLTSPVPTWRGSHTPRPATSGLILPPPLSPATAHTSGLICPIYVDPPTWIYMGPPSFRRFLCGCQKILFYVSTTDSSSLITPTQGRPSHVQIPGRILRRRWNHVFFLELRRDSRVTMGITGFLLCWPWEAPSSIRVARESWGLLIPLILLLMATSADVMIST